MATPPRCAPWGFPLPLLSAARFVYVPSTGITLDELKREAAVLSGEERLRLSAFLKHLERVDGADNRADLSRLNRAIDAGDCVTLERWRKMHAALQAEGL